jgi:O-antigen/teichoic acid export membrane protein
MVVLDSSGPADRVEPTPPADAPHARFRIAKNAFYLAIGQVGMTALAIIFSATLARALGPSQFGLYFLVFSITTFSYTFVEWGQPYLLLGDVARDSNRVGELLGTALALRILAAPIVLVPVLIITSLIGRHVSIELILAVFFIANLPTSLTQGFGTAFRGLDRMDRDALVCVLNSAVRLALVVAALALAGGLVAVALCQFAAGLAALIAALQFYRRLPGPPLALRHEVARRLCTGGALISILAVVAAAQPYFDVLILSKLAPPDVVGWFGAARNIMGTLIAPGIILATAAFPQLTRAAQAPDCFGSELRNALRPIMLAGAIGAAGTYLFAETAVEVIYGTYYAPAISILRLFAPALFLLFVDVLLGLALMAANRVKGLATLKVASVVISTALDAVLIPWFQSRYNNGGMGVVLAFALSELLMFVGMVAIMPRGALLLETTVDAAKAIGAGIATVVVLKSVPGLANAAGIPVAVVVFFAVAFALGLVRTSDLALLQDISRRRASGVRKES